MCQHPNNLRKHFHEVLLQDIKMAAIAKSAKTHSAAKKLRLGRTYHMLPGQMSPGQLASFKHGPKILPLKFCQNRVSNRYS